MDNKFNLQDSEYSIPYHHTVSFDEKDPRFYEEKRAGLEYYGYVSFVLDLVSKYHFDTLGEVGCGDGKIIYELAKRYPQKTFKGYDLSEKGTAFASAYAISIPNLSFFAQDFKHAEESFDIVLCIETLEHIPDKEIDVFLKTMHEKLTPQGKLIISVPTVNIPVSEKHYRHYNLNLLKTQVKEWFDIEQSHFVHNPKAWGFWLVRFLLINRFFILRYKPFRRFLFKQYVRHYRTASKHTGVHLIAVLKKTT